MSNGLKLSIVQMQSVAVKNGGMCLSLNYINNKTKLWWRCAVGHEWLARPDLIMRKKKPTWCRACAGKQQKSRDEIAAFAVSLGGTLHAQKVKGMHHAVLWLCGLGHLFKATPNNVKYGHWCPMCWNARRPEVIARNSRKGHARRKGRSASSKRRKNPARFLQRSSHHHSVAGTA